MAKLVAKTYGDALFELAVEEQKIDMFVTEVQAVMQAFNDNPELNKLMNHPKIVKEEKIQIIENIFKDHVSQEITGFLRVIVSKGRYNDIVSIFAYFIERVKEYQHIGTAFVVTAAELKENQKNDIMNKLIGTTHYIKIDMNFEVDAALVGGMVIRIGDRVVDSSIKTKLENMSKNLLSIQLA